jgi:DNA-binding NtrC family response regulator
MIFRSERILTPEAMEQSIVSAPVIGSDSLVPPSPYAGQAAEAAAQDVLNLRALEAIAIRQALQKTGGHKTKAAELLGINERTLRNKLKTDSLRT